MRPVKEACPDSMQLPFLYAYLNTFQSGAAHKNNPKNTALELAWSRARVHPRSRAEQETPNGHRRVPQQRACVEGSAPGGEGWCRKWGRLARGQSSANKGIRRSGIVFRS